MTEIIMNRSVVVAVACLLLSPAPYARNPLFNSPVSVEPWLSDSSRSEDISLSGDWQFEGGGCCIRFASHGGSDHVYDVHVPAFEEEDAIALTVSLHHVDGTLVLDLSQEDELIFGMSLHALFRVELDDDTMRLFCMDGESFESRAASAGIEHKDDLVLSSTEVLADFLNWQVGDPSFFEGEPEFTLRKVERPAIN